MGILILNTLEEGFKAIDTSVSILKNGGVIAFPTETVYGIGAIISEIEAVRRVYNVKKRVLSNPLTAMIEDIQQAEKLALSLPEEFYKLAEHFMPGPITLIVKKSPDVHRVVTGGLDSIGIRMPDNKAITDILKLLGVPLAATSANFSGQEPALDADHIVRQFSNLIDAVIDDGHSRVGIPSTVVCLTAETPIILRPGVISKEEIESALGKPILTNTK